MTTTTHSLRIDPEITVGRLVAERPSRSRVFEAFGIDYCCGGKKPLATACQDKGLDLDEVSAALEREAATPNGTAGLDPATMPLAQLADHIVETHHAYLREELPRLMRMLRRVAKVHGDADPRLRQMEKVFATFEEELYLHMRKEEELLFPAIRVLESGPGEWPFPFPSVAHPIRMMEFEHDQAGDALSELRTLSDGFEPPDWACNTYRAVLAGLLELEDDMHQHVHKENNVLFPRAIAAEASK